MVKCPEDEIEAVFSAIAHPVRRAIISRLVLKPSSIVELAQPFDMSLVAISKHIRVLEKAGLVSRHKEGRSHVCRFIGAAHLSQASQWLAQTESFWSLQLQSLDEYLS